MRLWPALFLAVFGPCLGADQPQESGGCVCPVQKMGATLVLDGQAYVTKSVLAGTGFETVWVSTPSTPAAGHAVIWLNQQGAAKSALRVKFDDGTVVSLAAN